MTRRAARFFVVAWFTAALSGCASAYNQDLFCQTHGLQPKVTQATNL